MIYKNCVQNKKGKKFLYIAASKILSFSQLLALVYRTTFSTYVYVTDKAKKVV